MTQQTKAQRKTPRSWQSWSWIFLVGFFLLSFVDIRFALAGFACMAAPVGIALAGRGKRHCSHYCPRGAFFGKFIPLVSLKKTLPGFMNRKWFKHVLLVMMFSTFGALIFNLGWGAESIGRAIFLMMSRSFLLGALIGVVYSPRSWCRICPMGHAAGLIRDLKKVS